MAIRIPECEAQAQNGWRWRQVNLIRCGNGPAHFPFPATTTNAASSSIKLVKVARTSRKNINLCSLASTENACFSRNLSHQTLANMPAPDTIVGQDIDILTHLFLNAPLPNLPRPCRLFQNEDINKPRARVLHQQLVNRYHTVAKAIETGFGANAILSPSAWVRTMLDIIS